MTYLYLAIAIVSEVVATSSLKAAAGFTRLGPSLIVVAGYGVAFWCMSLVMEKLPIGVTYAIWAGLGIVLVALVGAIVYRQIPDWPALVGICLIVAGVVVVQAFSKTMEH